MDPLFHFFCIDAFSTSAFGGNPAAVCVLKRVLPDATLQGIAREFNLSETVFIARRASGYDIRWFTPTVEVDLVGHATLAAAYAIMTHLEPGRTNIEFYSRRSGLLRAYGDRTSVSIDLPADTLQACDAPAALSSGLGRIPVRALTGLTASAHLRHRSRMQCYAGVRKTAQLHFRIHPRPPHLLGVPIEDRRG